MKSSKFTKKWTVLTAAAALAMIMPLISSANAETDDGIFKVKATDLGDHAIVGLAGMTAIDDPGGENPGGENPAPLMVFTIDLEAPGCPATGGAIHVGGVGAGAKLISEDGVESELKEGWTTLHSSGQWTIQGTFQSYGTDPGSGSNPKACLISVDRWDETGTVNINRAFMRALNITSVAEPPSTVRNMGYLFARSGYNNSEISSWNVENVLNMDSIFYQDSAFDQDLSSWRICNISGVHTEWFRFAKMEHTLEKHPQWNTCS